MQAVAQSVGSLQGKVYDNSPDVPMPFATVTVMKDDGTILAGAITDDKGGYVLTKVPVGQHKVLVSFIGYQQQVIPVSVGRDRIKLQDIVMKPDATTLEAVQITAKAPLLEQQMDKLVMNVAQSAFAQGNTAYDLMRKAPGVSIDKDGNILLNGSAVAVWIDGRPSQLDGKSLEAMLKGTAGTNIDKIEIIANPSAKYDAAGQGGIINIKTKRTLMQGLNGTISANGGGMGFRRQMEHTEPLTSVYLPQDASLNLNYRTEKTNTFLQLTENSQPMGIDLHTHTDITASGLQFLQESYTLYNAKAISAGLKIGNDWFIDSKNTLGVIFSMPTYYTYQTADTAGNRSYQKIGDVLAQIVKTNANTKSNVWQCMGNLNYTHIFDEATANELTANIDYLRNHRVSSNNIDNYFLPVAPQQALLWSLAPDSTSHIGISSDYVVDVYSAKVDWQRVVLKRFMMEAGAKWALSMTDNVMHRTDGAVGGPYIVVPTLSNYTEHIGALYATMAGQLSPQWTAKVGLRGEYTNAHNSSGTVKQNYLNLFPTIFVGYNTADMKHRYNLSYTRRIQRPHYSQLDPFQDYVDAHTYNKGNPNLKPSFSDNVYLSAGFGQHLSLYGTFAYTKDVITIVPKLNAQTGDQEMLAANFGNNTIVGGGITLSELPLGKAFTLLVNGGAYDYRNYAPSTASLVEGQEVADVPYVSSSFYGMLYACLTWNLPKLWKVQLDGWTSTPVESGYMHVGWKYSSNIAVKKTSEDNRFTFSISLNDIFRTMDGSFSVIGNDGVVSYYDQYYLAQKVSVGLQWNFGAAQKPLRQRKVGNIDEASRVGSNSELGSKQ